MNRRATTVARENIKRNQELSGNGLVNRRLIIMDIFLAIAVVILALVNQGKWNDALVGFIAITFVISLYNHIQTFITTKKFY